MLSFVDLRRAASATSSGSCSLSVPAGSPATTSAMRRSMRQRSAFELQRMRVAVRERHVDAVEERLRDRRFRGGQEVLDVVDDHAHVDAGANAPAQELSSTE